MSAAPAHAAPQAAPRASGPLLRLGARHDRLEQEADAVAARVLGSGLMAPPSLHAAAPQLQRNTRSPYSPDDGRRRARDEPAATLQRAPAGGAEPASLAPALAADIHGLRGGGEPLPGPVRGLLEPRFGHDFGRVRIHHHRSAQALARRVNARAFTLGHDVVFGAGQYDTGSCSGLHLLAHELTHVVQQGAAPRRPWPGVADAGPAISPAPGDATLRRMAWYPSVDTGTAHAPWGDDGPQGRILEARTDAGSTVETWRPDDGSTFWCHGYTFGGAGATGGPYSIFGSTVPQVLHDDGWHPVDACMAQPGDILVFYDSQDHEAHSGIVRSMTLNGSQVEEALSDLQSKWGTGMLATVSWATNARTYGHYSAYSKSPLTGVCGAKGVNER